MTRKSWIIINSCMVCKVIHWITKLIQIANTFYWQPCARETLNLSWSSCLKAGSWRNPLTSGSKHEPWQLTAQHVPCIMCIVRLLFSSVPMENGQKTVQANFGRVTTHRCQSRKPLIGCFSTQSWGWRRFVHEHHRNRRSILKEGKEGFGLPNGSLRKWLCLGFDA